MPPAAGQPFAVAGAGEALIKNVGGGLRQRQRQISEVGGEFRRFIEPMCPVAELVAQVGCRLLGCEHPNVDQRVAPRESAGSPAGGDHRTAGGGGRWPQVVQFGRVGEVVQHDEPTRVGAGQPGQQPGSRLLGVAVPYAGDVGGGLGVAGDHSGANGGGDPDEQVDPAHRPQLVGEVRRELGLADPIGSNQDLARHHRLVTGHAGQRVVGRATLVAVRQRGHHPDAVRPGDATTITVELVVLGIVDPDLRVSIVLGIELTARRAVAGNVHGCVPQSRG